jgi:hypothetical protein
VACPFASVVCEPLVFTEPTTEKRSVIPGVELPNTSLLVAVTQCCASTGLVSSFGASVSEVGGPTGTGSDSKKMSRSGRFVKGAIVTVFRLSVQM